jgi:hypothetical protein
MPGLEILTPHGLASLPGWLVFLLTVAVPVALALGFGRAMHALFTPHDFTVNATVGAVKYGFVVEIYAVVAALTLVGAWDSYQTSRDTLQKEAGGLYMLALSVDSFAGPAMAEERAEMRAAIRAYASAVASGDWPRMQDGIASQESDHAFQRLTRAFLDASGETSGQQALQQNLGAWLADIASARIARLSVPSRSLAGLIWMLVLTVSVAVIAFQWFFGGGNAAMHYAMGAVIAVIVGSVLMVSLKLAFPYVGDPPLLTPRPFLALMEVQ